MRKLLLKIYLTMYQNEVRNRRKNLMTKKFFERCEKLNWGNGFYRKEIGFRIIDIGA